MHLEHYIQQEKVEDTKKTFFFLLERDVLQQVADSTETLLSTENRS